MWLRILNGRLLNGFPSVRSSVCLLSACPVRASESETTRRIQGVTRTCLLCVRRRRTSDGCGSDARWGRCRPSERRRADSRRHRTERRTALGGRGTERGSVRVVKRGLTRKKQRRQNNYNDDDDNNYYLSIYFLYSLRQCITV